MNNLTLDNGVLDVTGEGNTLKVDSLQGTSGNVRLGARMVDGRVVANNVQVGSVSQKVKGLDVTFDGVTSDEVETPEEVADLMKNSVTIGLGKSEDFKQTGTVEEGAINGSVSVETDAKGEIVSSTTAENTKLEDFKEVTSVSFVQWRNEVNHLTRRMGDLRSSESGVGAWARVHGGESKVKNSSVEFDTTSVQVGADARVEDWIVGSAHSYSDSSIDLASGDGDGESWSLAVYASRFFDSGAFIDLTGRYGYLKNEFTSKDMGVKTDNHAFALSAEVGHRFEVAKNAYVEPQVEVAYGFIKGDNVTASNGVRVEQDDAQTLTGRVGLRFGADCPNDRGTVYGLVSYNYEFLGDIESRASLGDKSARMERSLDGGWFSYGIGAQANISKTWSAYGELERTSGGDVENPWRWSVGDKVCLSTASGRPQQALRTPGFLDAASARVRHSRFPVGSFPLVRPPGFVRRSDGSEEISPLNRIPSTAAGLRAATGAFVACLNFCGAAASAPLRFAATEMPRPDPCMQFIKETSAWSAT